METQERIKPEDVINFRQALNPQPSHHEPVIDKLVSEKVGKPVRATDPRLIKLIVKWKQAVGESNTPNNFMDNPEFVKELQETFK